MIFQIILALIFGVFLGTLTGLIPGIHTNLIAILLLLIAPELLTFFPATTLLILITAMAITHTFLDFIPSIYFGAPDEDSVLSIQPGHRFLLKGKGHEAVKYTLAGSLISTFLILIITPIFIYIIPRINQPLERMMSWFLIWIAIFLIRKEKNSRFWAITIFLLSGFLGISSLNLNINQPLLPLLTGLFGASTLIYSIHKGEQIPEQQVTKIKISKTEIFKPTLTTALISPICSFFPGLGSSQAAIIGSSFYKKITQKEFLILLGSINTLVVSVSFITFYLIQKTRTGIASAVSQIIPITLNEIYIILLTILITGIIAYFIGNQISKKIAKNISKINYPKFSKLILIFLVLITILISGITGLLILIISTSLGLLAITLNIRKSLLMGCLLLPAIIYYLPF
jgi:putative membrane protein